MSKLILLSCVALLTAAAPANAAPPIANQVATAEQSQPIAIGGGEIKPAVPFAEKKICRDLPSSYTRMTERVCLTRQEWDRVQLEVEDR